MVVLFSRPDLTLVAPAGFSPAAIPDTAAAVESPNRNSRSSLRR